MKRGLSITAYQFHKLLQYEQNYERTLKNKNLIAQATNVVVPLGDKFDKLRSNSIKFHSQNPKLGKIRNPMDLHKSGFPSINVKGPVFPDSHKINLKHSLQFNNPNRHSVQNYNAHHASLKTSLQNNDFQTPSSSKQIGLFPSQSNNNSINHKKITYPKSLNGSAQKIPMIYSQPPDRYSARVHEHHNSNHLSSFNLYQRQKKSGNMLNKSNQPKIKPAKQGKRAKTAHGNNINNINIYKTGYSKHLKRSKLKPHHKKKESQRMKMAKQGTSHSVPQKFMNLKNKRVAPPKPFKLNPRPKRNHNLRKVKTRKHIKQNKNGAYGNDFYSKTNDELDAEYDEAQRRQNQGFKQKWKKFTSEFFSMFGN
jgi:hypothetical protein